MINVVGRPVGSGVASIICVDGIAEGSAFEKFERVGVGELNIVGGADIVGDGEEFVAGTI